MPNDHTAFFCQKNSTGSERRLALYFFSVTIIIFLCCPVLFSQEIVAHHSTLVFHADDVAPLKIRLSIMYNGNGSLRIIDPFFKTPMIIAVEAEKEDLIDTLVFVGTYRYSSDSLNFLQADSTGVSGIIEVPARSLKSFRSKKVCSPFVLGARWRLISTTRVILNKFSHENGIRIPTSLDSVINESQWKSNWELVRTNQKIPMDPIDKMLSSQDPCW